MISFGSEVLSFDVVEFLEAPVESDLFAHFCGEKCLYQFSGDRIADYSSADAEYVHVVMYYALSGRIGVVAHRSAHASELVRGYCCADSAAAQYDASICLARLDRLGYGRGPIRIIVFGVVGMGAEIYDVMSSRFDSRDNRFAQVESSVISAYCYSHR